MDLKIVTKSQAPPPFPKQGVVAADVWEPPFERWLRLTDAFLAQNPACSQKLIAPPPRTPRI